jgi:hypothetical protein
MAARFRYHSEQGRDPGPVRPVQIRTARLPPLQDGDAVRVIRRKTNRRHMTGDHHGRTAGRATLLVTAADEILGTHNQ